MRHENIFISIEGVDGVGKTTVATLLSADGAFQYHKCPSGEFAKLRGEVDVHATPLERYCFYRLASQFDSEQIRRSLCTDSVVSDRYIASTAAYHFAMDDRVRSIHDESGILKPHFAFLLGARSEVRTQRMAKRAIVSSDARLEADGVLLDRVAEIFMLFDLIYIDVSDISAMEVVTEIKRIIAQGGVT